MSIRLMSKVFESSLRVESKMVLLALANWANEDGVCWPSQDKIAAYASLSLRATRDNLHELERDGWFTILEPGGGRGKRTVYGLNAPKITEINPAVAAPFTVNQAVDDTETRQLPHTYDSLSRVERSRSIIDPSEEPLKSETLSQNESGPLPAWIGPSDLYGLIRRFGDALGGEAEVRNAVVAVANLAARGTSDRQKRRIVHQELGKIVDRGRYPPTAYQAPRPERPQGRPPSPAADTPWLPPTMAEILAVDPSKGPRPPDAAR